MQRIILLLIALSAILLAFACSGQDVSGGGNSPTDAYKRLFAAVKSKDVEAIKKQLTKKTIDLGKMSMERYKKTSEQAFENGFTATTYSEALPNIRDERISGDMGNIEVWNSKESKWEDLPFVREDGSWKLAMGDLFAGSFKSPGPGRDFLAKQAANAVSNTTVVLGPNTNLNSNSPAVSNSIPVPPKSNKNLK